MTLLLVNGYQQVFGKDGEQPIAMGVLGLKVMLGYLPLIPCAYYLLRSKQDFYLLMRLTIGLIILCCGLAMIQYLLLLTGKCAGTRMATGSSLFKASLEAHCFVGGALTLQPTGRRDSTTWNLCCSLAVGLVFDFQQFPGISFGVQRS